MLYNYISSKVHAMKKIATILLLLLALTAVQTTNSTNSTNSTFQPTSLFTIYNSALDSFIDSESISYLNVSSMVNQTTVNLVIFNTSSWTKNNIYQLSFFGNYTYLTGTRTDLSCSMFYDQVELKVSLVHFNGKNLEQKGIFSLSNFTNETNPTILKTKFRVSKDCSFLQFDSPSGLEISMLMPPLNYTYNVTTQLQLFPVPPGWTQQAVSQDLFFRVSANNLTQYITNMTSTGFSQVYTFLPHLRYKIYSNQNRVIVVASNSSVSNAATTPPTNSSDYLIYVLDAKTSVPTLVNSFTIAGVIQQGKQADIFVSPQLTKIIIHCNYSNGSSGAIVKHFNFDSNTALDISFANPSRFLETVTGIHLPQEFFLGDFFFVLRNASKYNRTLPNNKAYELTYQFMGDKVIFMKERELSLSLSNSTNTSNISDCNLYGNCSTQPNSSYTQCSSGSCNIIGVPYIYSDAVLAEHKEFGLFTRMWIDNTVTDQLNWLGIYIAFFGSNVEQLTYLQYGNLATQFNISKSVASAYVNFTEPQPLSIWYYNRNTSLGSEFQWAFANYNYTGNTTSFKVFFLDHSKPSHVNSTAFDLPNEFHLLSHARSCLVLSDLYNNNSIHFYNYNYLNNSYTVDPFDFNSLFGNNQTYGLSLNLTTSWSLTPSCDRFRLGDLHYYRDGAGNYNAMNNPSNFSASIVDDSVSYAIASDGNLYKYDAATFAYVLLFTPPTPFLNTSSIASYQNRLLINGTSFDSVWAYAYAIETNGSLTLVLNHTESLYLLRPTTAVSPQLTKFFVVGPRDVNSSSGNGSSSVEQTGKGFHLDWASRSTKNIAIPKTPFVYGMDYFITAGEEYFSLRQLRNNYTWYWGSLKSHLYYLEQGSLPRLMYQQNITSANVSGWKYSAIINNGSGTYLYDEGEQSIYDFFNPGNSSSFRVVNVSELIKEQSYFNQEHNSTFFTEVKNGALFLHHPGCTDLNCSNCMDGYTLDNLTRLCKPCAPGCRQCLSSDVTRCTSCDQGLIWDYNSTSCSPCSSNCLSCSWYSTSCSSCVAGTTLDYTTFYASCTACPANCRVCNYYSGCQTCESGFVLISNATCRGCSIFCSSCNPTNITECTGCADGFQLIGGKCDPCPSNCLECNGSSCILCRKGFSSNSNGVCVSKCEVSCVTCMSSQPSVCLVCQSGSTLVSGKCVLDISCNANNSCTSCGQGIGYFLVPVSSVGGYCSQCPNITNCLQCNPNNAFYCLLCANGYFLETNGTCTSCSSNCTYCSSNTTCTACSPGWTLVGNTTRGMCLTCQSPCATCEESQVQCTSCMPGFTRKGWKCLSASGMGFEFVLNAAAMTVLADIDNIVTSILTILSQDTNETSIVAFESITEITVSSTLLIGVATPTKGSCHSSSVFRKDLASGLTGLNYSVSSVNVTGNQNVPGLINTSALFSYNSSPKDNITITSEKIENLELSSSYTSTNATNFTIKYFNSSAFYSYSQYSQQIPGDWNYLNSSMKTLSCILVRQNNGSLLSFLQSTGSSINLLGSFPITNLMTLNYSSYSFINMYHLGQNCELFKFKGENGTILYRPSFNWTQLLPVALPAGWNWQAYSDDLTIAISANKLYQYNKTLSAYQELYTFPTYLRYEIKNYQDRVVVAAVNSVVSDSTTNPPTNSSSYSIYAFQISSSGAVITTMVNATGVKEQKSLAIVLVSPKLSKIAIVYEKLDGSKDVIAKHVGYGQAGVLTLQFNNPTQFLDTAFGVNKKSEIAFGDSFLVVRNGSKYNQSHPEIKAVEIAYQIAGSQVKLLSLRGLSCAMSAVAGSSSSTSSNSMNSTNSSGTSVSTDKELGLFEKMLIDEQVSDQLNWLGVYRNSSNLTSVFDVEEIKYGNLATQFNISKSVASAYVNFTEPQPLSVWYYNRNTSLGSEFQWAFANYNYTGNTTSFKVFFLDHSKPSHVNSTAFDLPNEFHLLSHARSCLVLSDLYNNNSIHFYNYNYLNNSYTVDPFDFNSLFGNNQTYGLSLNLTTSWSLTPSCDRFRLGDLHYYRDGAGNYNAMNNPSNFSASIVDDSVSYAIASDGNLYKYDAATFAYVLLFTPPTPFLNTSSIASYQNRLLINGTSFDSVWAYAYAIETNGSLTLVLNHTESLYLLRPTTAVSPQLTKFFVVGPRDVNSSSGNGSSSVEQTGKGFHLDWASRSTKNIAIPKTPFVYGMDYFITAGEEYFSLRQLRNNYTWYWGSLKSHLYYLEQGSLPRLMYQQNITSANVSGWKYSAIINNGSGTYLYDEGEQSIYDFFNPGNSSSFRVVNVSELIKEQSYFNQEHNSTFFTEVKNGALFLHHPGCTDLNCSNCMDGYTLDNLTRLCKPCAPGCRQCLSSDVTRCTSCDQGLIWDYNSTSCSPCSSNCLSCSWYSTSCSSCVAGTTLDYTTFYASCTACPANCRVCNYYSGCQTCESGFVLISNATCRGCSIFCSSCNPTNITECTGCADGFQLIGGKCDPCPSNCLECNGSSCILCRKGFSSNSNGVCVSKCEVSCVTCMSSQPSVCLVCQSGSTLVSGKCVLDISCNANNSCTSCGQGIGYFLVPVSSVGGYCSQCPNITNCLQCNPNNAFYCLLCANGYFLETNGTCTSCSSNCTYCSSNTTCTACSPGWTLVGNTTRGMCLTCQSPCATCEESQVQCTSCMPGFTRKGWKCLSASGMGFEFVLNAAAMTVLADIDNIVTSILTILNQDTNETSIVAFESITEITVSSTLLIGVATPTKGSCHSSSVFRKDLASGLTGLNYSVSSVNVTGNQNVPGLINTSALFSYNSSPKDNITITSEKIENLELSSSYTSTNATNFTIKYFNSSAFYSYSQYSQQIPGDWNYLNSSMKTLSCILVRQNNGSLLSFLQSTGSSINLLGSFPITNLMTLNYSSYSFINMYHLGQNCELFKFKGENGTILYRPSFNWTQLLPVALPAGWNWQAYSDDLTIAISANKLYQYNKTLSAYQELYTFPTYLRYEIKNYQDRVVVAAVNSVVSDSTTNPPTNSSSYSIYAFQISSSGAVITTMVNATGVKEQKSLAIVLVSPKLSKIAIVYEKLDGSKDVIAKHVGYGQAGVLTLQFNNPTQFLDTAFGVNKKSEIAFGDSFLVVRNGSKYNLSHPENRAVEAAYQFIGSKIDIVQNRTLSCNMPSIVTSTVTVTSNTSNSTNSTTVSIAQDKELGLFQKMWIDNSLTDQLKWLGVYRNSSNLTSVFDVEEIKYGNLATQFNISKSVASAYVNFTEPQPLSIWYYNRNTSLGSEFQWAFANYNYTGNTTSFKVFFLDHSKPSHVNSTAFDLPNEFHLLSHARSCLVLSDLYNNNSIHFYNYNYLNNSYTVDPFDFNSLFGNNQTYGLSLNLTTSWSLTPSCDRFRLGNLHYYRDGAGNYNAMNNPSNFSASIVDDSVSYAIASDGNLYKYDAATFAYVLLFTPPTPFLNTSSIASYQNRLLINGTSFDSVWAYAYAIETNGSLTLVLNHTESLYLLRPTTAVSPQLTKFFVVGPRQVNSSSGNLTTIKSGKGFHIDWASQIVQNITIPETSLTYGMDYFITAGEEYFSLRQLTKNYTSYGNPLKFFLYYLNTAMTPLLVYSQNNVNSTQITWRYSAIIKNGSQTHFYDQREQVTYLANGTQSGSYRIVNVSQIAKEQAVFNNENNFAYSSEVNNGKILLCPTGCVDCSCSSCLSGYAFQNLTSTCSLCAPGCTACSADNATKCTSCQINLLYDSANNSCSECDTNCLSCANSSTVCTSCKAGMYLVTNRTCVICPLNCKNCTSETNCVLCNEGFTMTPNGTCRTCSTYCSDCNPNNIMECTTCGEGLQLLNGKCQPCPTNCLQCNGNICYSCRTGFTVNSNNVCITQCEISCITCHDNQPKACITCQSGANLVGGTCVLDTTCNLDNTCTYCGQGLGYFLVPASSTGGYCSQCPTIANCLQCDPLHVYYCVFCSNGYFAQLNGTCSQCSTNCTSCVSNLTCTSCAPKFTLVQNTTRGTCFACQSPCETCENSPTHCTSCLPGFTRVYQKCRNNTYIAFRFVITVTLTIAYSDIDNIMQGILILLNQTTNDTSIIFLEEMATGSTVIAGSATPTQGTTQGSSDSMVQGLANGLPGTSYVVTGAQVSVQTPASNSEITEDSAGMGMIIGAAVGGIFLIAVIVIVIVIVKKRRASARVDTEDTGRVQPINQEERPDSGEVVIMQPQMKQTGGMQESYQHMTRNTKIEIVDFEKEM